MTDMNNKTYDKYLTFFPLDPFHNTLLLIQGNVF